VIFHNTSTSDRTISNRPRSLHSTSLPSPIVLITSPFELMQTRLLTASINKHRHHFLNISCHHILYHIFWQSETKLYQIKMAYLRCGCPCPQHKCIRGVAEVRLHLFLTSTPDGGQWSASCSSRFRARERAPVPIVQDAGPALQPVWMLPLTDCPANSLATVPTEISRLLKRA
jgi:hypothetical protein